MKLCINCYTENPDDVVFCSGCGMSLMGAPTGEEAMKLKEKATKPEEPPIGPEPQPPPSGETPTGQTRLAYRLAAILLFVGASLNIIDALSSGGAAIAQYLTPIGIDVGLGIYLLRFSGRARLWVLVRAVLGGIVWPILAFLGNDPFTAVVMSAMQLGYSSALVLLLTGQSKTWRIALALGLFVVLTLGTLSLALLILALAILMGV
jgi:hypothetical protein